MKMKILFGIAMFINYGVGLMMPDSGRSLLGIVFLIGLAVLDIAYKD